MAIIRWGSRPPQVLPALQGQQLHGPASPHQSWGTEMPHIHHARWSHDAKKIHVRLVHVTWTCAVRAPALMSRLRDERERGAQDARESSMESSRRNDDSLGWRVECVTSAQECYRQCIVRARLHFPL